MARVAPDFIIVQLHKSRKGKPEYARISKLKPQNASAFWRGGLAHCLLETTPLSMKSDDFICGRHFRTRFWCGLIVGGFFCASAVSLRAAPNLAPEMTIHFPLNKDPRPWVIADSLTNGPAGSVMVYTSEWVPKGDSIEAWKEMFDEKTILTTETITHHLDIWKALMARDAPGTTVTVITNADGTSTVGYKAIAADEMGISRYIQGKDGIYILSYRVRPRVNSEARMKIWEDILSSATLVKNNVQGGR